MAPRKRKLTAQEKEQVARVGAQLEALVARDTARGGSAQRVTRSLTQTAASGSSAEPRPVAPARKKAKGAQKKKEPAKKVKPAAEEAEGEAVKEEKENSVESEAEAEAENKNEKGKEKLEDKNAKGKEKVEDDGEATKHTGNEWDKRTIVIEHWQCKSFKTRADEVKDSLEKGVPGIKVLLNPDKPRKGCFEIREEGGETFISLLDMERPFSEMEELNMEDVIADIIEKIK
ncbi:uncharacterized protein LOC103953652 isoform X2 [Pyrus x bretschneideri]|uniref:uncharacterized protein LOC103953652 isoform X2 n=1 Tax=Pyrus x bretschneideri TaxID=225117 RepID=UPI0020308931|nr:uncharacterized protein LOC103953652 isoform X2 [Pyrus x bretschneideri]